MKLDRKKVNLIILVGTSILAVLLGALSLMQVLRIYFGNGSFSREISGKYILEILPVIIVFILTVIFNGIYFTKVGYKESPAKRTQMSIYLQLKDMVLLDKAKEEDKEALAKLRKLRIIVQAGCVVVSVVCLVLALLYVCNGKNFEGEPTECIINMVIHLLPWMIIFFGVSIFAIFYIDYLAKKSNAILKSLLKNGKQEVKKENNKKLWLIATIAKCVILVTAITFMIVGIATGGAKDVFIKAVNICTECIGLG